MEWLNEPPAWQEADGVLTVTAGSKTDFWRTTHYGFVRDDGHLYGRRLAGDFTADVTVRGEYAALYDQAGLMVRHDETTWIKCGIELVDGVQHASAVVTRGFSDWSVVPLPANPPAIRLRVLRNGDALEIGFAPEGTAEYALLRLAYFPPDVEVLIGPFCAAPEGGGFRATFEGFTLSAG